MNWPPAGVADPGFRVSGWRTGREHFICLEQSGWTHRPPTTQERRDWFDPARCAGGHTVTGHILLDPQGTRYPFALCDGQEGFRHALVPFPPYEIPEP